MATKRAVIVGIDDYTGMDPSGQNNLSCCVADATSVAALLPSQGFDASEVKAITNQAATRAAVMAALAAMVRASEPGDVACFYFSGHGTIAPADPADPSCERFHEAMCTATRPFLTDKDLFSIASQLQQSVVNFTVISDSCMSGGMAQEVDAVAKYKSLAMDGDLIQRVQGFMNTWIPVGIAVPSNADVCGNNVSNVQVTEGGHLMCEEDPSQIFVSLAKMTLISGCRFWELSYEINGHGLLTQALLDTVNSDDFQINYGELVHTLQQKVEAGFQTLLPSVPAAYPKSQTPQLRGQGNRMEEGFLQPWSASR
jgi:Caspase domain